MAERRMFAKTIIDSDEFLDMPLSTQALYFHLSMRADDDGFINNPKKIQRMVGASDDDAKILIAKEFILPFESGVVVIRHWKIHNYIRNDRYKETLYKEEKSLLGVTENNTYEFGIPNDNQMVYQLDTQYSIGKDSIGKDSIDTFATPNENDSVVNDKCGKKKKKNATDEEIQELFNAYTTDEEVLELFQDWLDVRKQKRLAKTVRAIKENLNKLDECASNSNMSVVDYLKEVVRRSWGAFYVVPNYEKGNNNGYNGNTQGARNRQDEHLVRSGSVNGANNKQDSEVKRIYDEDTATKRFYEITSRPDWKPEDFFRD